PRTARALLHSPFWQDRRMDPAVDLIPKLRGSLAMGASAYGATAIGAAALGALAVGAVAVGALAIGRLALGEGRVTKLVIDELEVKVLRVGSVERLVEAD
ncbi:MAG TPA: hypothetical protein VM575_01770, partial [Nocardioides sp.]|nr:hypothetical protein [Nocardioides sp.]